MVAAAVNTTACGPCLEPSFVCTLKFLDSGVAMLFAALLVLEMGFTWVLTQVKG